MAKLLSPSKAANDFQRRLSRFYFDETRGDIEGGLFPPSTREWIPDEASETIILSAGEKLGGKGGNEDYPRIRSNVSGSLHSLSLTTRRRTRFWSVLGVGTERSSEIG